MTFFAEGGRAIVLGGSGMLARAFCELLESRDISFTRATRAQCDLTNPSSISQAGIEDFDLVINSAAWTDVDGAEEHEASALATNGGEGLSRLCELVRASDATLIHFSTDYVFNGMAQRPYLTDHPRDPVNAYGRSKAAGELVIEASGCRAIVARTSWLYAPWGKNFVRTIAKLCLEKHSLSVVDDQRGRPTSCEHLAWTSLALLDAGGEGMFHVCDGGECTWFQFAGEIARLLNSPCDIQPCTSDAFPRPAPRPAYSVLDLTKTEALVGAMPDWKSNLASVVSRLQSERGGSHA